jgi:hypothetical protein
MTGCFKVSGRQSVCQGDLAWCCRVLLYVHRHSQTAWSLNDGRREQLSEALGFRSTVMQLIALQNIWVHLFVTTDSHLVFCYNVSECQSHETFTTIWHYMIMQTVQLLRQKLDHNLFISTLLLIKAHLASQKQRRTLFGLLLPLTVCTNVVYGIMSDKDFFHKEDGGIVLSKMLVLVYQNTQFDVHRSMHGNMFLQ